MPNIAVFIEQRNGALKKVAWQMISEARRLADAAGGDRFGGYVATSLGTVVVGAYGDDDAGAESGSAYVFFDPDRPPPAGDGDDRDALAPPQGGGVKPGPRRRKP